MTNHPRIAVIAPCPIGLEIENGWFDRIKVIDDLIHDQQRIYFRVAPDNSKPIGESVIRHNDLAQEAFIDFNNDEHLAYVAKIIENVEILYVHTLHYAEFALPYLDTGKVIVDIHGVTPEEEVMMGNPELSPKYEEIEQAVLEKALRCIMVTRSMEDHYKEKYPDLSPRVMILPIVQNYETSLETDNRIEMAQETPVRVIYAGGLQAWQQVDKMLDVARQTNAFATYTFLSAEQEQLKDMAGDLPVTITYAGKDTLSDYYFSADFGFILREDCAVNRVACPTKLFDYMWHGVIPITDTPHLGDFEAFGYEHISMTDFIAGFFPDKASREWMRKKNHQVVQKMHAAFVASENELKAFLART